MTKILVNIFFAAFAFCFAVKAGADNVYDAMGDVYVEEFEGMNEPVPDEDAYTDVLKTIELHDRMSSFMQELADLREEYSAPFKISGKQRRSESYMRHLQGKVKQDDRKLKSVDLRWNIFFQAEQPDIAADEALTSIVEDFNLTKQAIEDSITARTELIAALNDFTSAETFLAAQDTAYNSIGRRALELSLTQQTAPQLENLKVKEQLLFADIQSRYDAARKATQSFSFSPEEIENLDNAYALLKNKSSKIQEISYQPPLQRIKDYLFGLAAVAIIIMFINMVVGKVKAYRNMKENMKKYQEMMNNNGNNDIPSI